MLHQEFISSEANRRRYWARALPGYSRFYAAQPTEAHKGLAELERRGWLKGVITQNVDRLHHHAGTKRLIHLHGRGDLVHCRNCGAEQPRLDFHKRLAERNAEWVQKAYDAISRAQMMADADAALSEDLVRGFEVEDCSECGVGVVMPSVVFFGGAIPAAIKEEARELIDSCTRILAIGTSLQTFSSFDLCRTAVKSGKPLGIVCIGDTRADSLATLHVPTTCDDAVARLCSALGDAPGT